MNEEYIFVCIGTNKLISDSFGPRVGQILKNNFKNYPKVKIFGTMENPVHFKNAPSIYKKIIKNKNEQIILIDSAFGKKENIGFSYINLGGIKIGSAYGKSFYFPAIMNIKTVVGTKNYLPNWKECEIEKLAQNLADFIIKEPTMFL